MDFRFQCATCEYYTKTKFNFTRHIKSLHHIKYCVDIENKDVSGNNTCILCQKKFKTRQQLFYHKKHCVLDEVEESTIEMIDGDSINEIKQKLTPMTMKEFVYGIKFNISDFEMSDLSKDNIFENTLGIFKRKLDTIDPLNRPFHNFNEDKNQMKIHYFTGSAWQIDDELNILRQFYENNDEKIPDSFMYYIGIFHDRRLKFYRKKCNVKSFVAVNLCLSASCKNQMKLLKKLASYVCYEEIENDIGYEDEINQTIVKDAKLSVDSHLIGNAEDV